MSSGNARRQFLKQLGIGAAALTGLPSFLPRVALGNPEKPGANDIVNIALIGSGTRARQIATNLPATGRIVAVCDVDLPKAELAKKELNGEWKVYQDYREILDKEQVDGVVLCMCDHNRILPAIHACQASKDIYVEKPFSLYVTEGRALVNAVRRYNRICQTGTQSRTIGINQTALRLVREGKLGKLKSIVCRNYSTVKPFPGGAEQPIPEGFDWDKWCGQTEMFPHNNDAHRAWGDYINYCGGSVTFLGAHAYDMIQCALGTDETGPTEIWSTAPESSDPPIRMKYANGFEVSLEADEKSSPYVGAIFTCENGKIELNENVFRSNPKELAKQIPEPESGEVGYRVGGWMGKSHLANWIECIKTRKRPNAYEEIGHRSATVCHLVNIAKRLKRHLRWDPDAERFVGDDEANAQLDRPRRKGYELPTIKDA
jgi:predicted dehydrogenase